MSHFAHVNHAHIRPWNQPVLSNGTMFLARDKRRELLMGLELMNDILRVKRHTHCVTSPLIVMADWSFSGTLCVSSFS